jgi:tRNA 2-selenouridine synthase
MSHISIENALTLKHRIIIDVRSPKEFEESHIVDAINWPILDNLERETVGKIYKHSGKEKAVSIGLDAVQGKLKDFYDKMLQYESDYDHVILYCSRGGMRSDSLYNFACSLGFKKLYKVVDGYKAYRNLVISKSDEMLESNPIDVIHGPTGVGKTKILKALELKGVSVIDLEELAQNAGSVFGTIPFNMKPPSQKMFENMIYEKLRTLKRPIFVESESRRIGTVTLTDSFHKAMKRGNHLLVTTDLENRINVISEFYLPALCSDQVAVSINHLRKQLGHKKVDQLLEWIEEKSFDKVIESLIVDYYDPLYEYSIKQYDHYVEKIHYQKIEEAVDRIEKYFYEVNNEK